MCFFLFIIFFLFFFFFFFFNDTATTEIYTLSLHDALPILRAPFTWTQFTTASAAFTLSPIPTAPVATPPRVQAPPPITTTPSAANVSKSPPTGLCPQAAAAHPRSPQTLFSLFIQAT